MSNSGEEPLLDRHATTDERRRRPRRTKSRRKVLGVVLGVVALLVVAVAAWVGVRGYQAKGELEAAIPLVTQLKTQVTSGDSAGAIDSMNRLTQHAQSAADLTSDPVWRATELLPWVGSNLTVMRELSSTVNDVSRYGIQPLTGLAGSIGLSDFKPVDGRVDLQPLLDAQGVLADSSAAVGNAVARVDALDGDGVIQPLADARLQLLDKLTEASGELTILSKAAVLLPAMLGADGPRNYLLLFQNNAELRSTGGIPGALALVNTDAGSIKLSQQTSGSSFRQFPEPVIELPLDTKSLYGDNTAEFMQDVNFTPNFALSGQIAREMWNRKFGLQVDGVISLDPVALSYLLKATGPIALPSGDQLTSENAVKLLLQDVYAKYEQPPEQDAFFASAAAAVFDKVASGNIDPAALVSALGQAGDENRVLVWSANDEDQQVLAGTTLAGGLPKSSETEQRFGVYFNDSTTAKMDPYLQVNIEAGQAVCRNDGLPLNSVRVTLTNTAPADAATSLPDYVTGGGEFGIPPGNIRTNIAAYGAEGLYNLGLTRDGAAFPYQPSTELGYGVSKVEIELAPGDSTVLDFQFLGDTPQTKAVSVQHTPFVYALETKALEVDCQNALQ
ncbi:DUF4012 domain-containing protein [Agreia sp. Leaf210]|uniref:DUF4012 domain-containing protein n=1 Tax=Agreia sp. Leaf210 TaxID=1735682 RepID=UPI000AC04781|nr:DUF4012 domain-containing protein [Agreia sp. Leaf210]